MKKHVLAILLITISCACNLSAMEDTDPTQGKETKEISERIIPLGLPGPGGTMLHEAVESENEERVKGIISTISTLCCSNAKIVYEFLAVQDQNGDTALHIAAQEGECTIAIEILGATRMVEGVSESPLEFNYPKLANIENRAGKTPRDLAIDGGHEDLIRLFDGVRTFLQQQRTWNILGCIAGCLSWNCCRNCCRR
jgi:hypothetical protein